MQRYHRPPSNDVVRMSPTQTQHIYYWTGSTFISVFTGVSSLLLLSILAETNSHGSRSARKYYPYLCIGALPCLLEALVKPKKAPHVPWVHLQVLPEDGMNCELMGDDRSSKTQKIHLSENRYLSFLLALYGGLQRVSFFSTFDVVTIVRNVCVHI